MLFVPSWLKSLFPHAARRLLAVAAVARGRGDLRAERGGLGKAHQLFGEQLPKLLDELNQVLAA